MPMTSRSSRCVYQPTTIWTAIVASNKHPFRCKDRYDKYHRKNSMDPKEKFVLYGEAAVIKWHLLR